MRPILIGIWAILLTVPAQATFAANNLSCKVYAPKQFGLLARCEGPFSGPGGSVSISLYGTAPHHVSEVRLSTGEGSFQRLKLKAEPVIDLETVGILFMDFDFDGLEDLAVMEFLPAGPNVPYLYYLYDKRQAKFVRNQALAKITSPEPQPDTKQIRSTWRSNAATSGLDTYAWRGGNLVLVSRFEDRHSGSSCERRSYQLVAGALKHESTGGCP